MKKAFFRLMVVVLFIGLFTIVSGSTQSKACDARPAKKACFFTPVNTVKEQPGGDLIEAFFLTSVFQI